jgi:hypothetical protein
MRALPLNSTFLVLVFLFIWSLSRTRSIWQLLSSRTLLAFILFGASVNIAYSSLSGYINPRDFVQDVVAAHQFLDHKTLYPSDLATLGVGELAEPLRGRAILERLPGIRSELSTLSDPPVAQNAHPPVLGALLAAPVSLLGLRGTFLLVFLLSVVLLYWSVTAILRELFPPVAPLLLWAVMGLIFAWYQVGLTLRGAQPSIVLLALITAAWLLLRRNQPWLAGSAIGLATCLHAFPALLLLYFALRVRKAFLAGILTIGALTAAAAALTIPGTYRQWLATTQTVSHLYIPRPGNLSIAGMLSGLGANEKLIAPAMLALIALALGIYLWPWRPRPDRLDLEYSIFIAAMLLASPISWGRYLPIMLLPIAVLIRKWREDPPSWAIPALLASMILMACPDHTYEWLSTHLTAHVMNLPSFSLIAVLIWLSFPRPEEL